MGRRKERDAVGRRKVKVEVQPKGRKMKSKGREQHEVTTERKLRRRAGLGVGRRFWAKAAKSLPRTWLTSTAVRYSPEGGAAISLPSLSASMSWRSARAWKMQRVE